MTRVGLVLSGCGFQDGSEIHEAVLAMLCLQEAGAEVVCYAPDKPQSKTVDHAAGRDTGERRSILSESARIARGRIEPLTQASPDQLDALVLPGGFGAALNLCDFASKGADATVDPELARLLAAMHEAGKPIGAICIAPVILAKVFGRLSPRLTIGNDAGTARAVEAMGAEHRDCAVTDCIVDEKNKLITSPAYMYDAAIQDVHQGIRKLAGEVVRLARR